jgi:hypothetical protein
MVMTRAAIKSNHMNKKIIIGIIAVIIAVGLFYGGIKYGEAHVGANAPMRGAQFARGQAGQNGAARNGQFAGARGGAGLVAGDVLSKDATSITLKLRDGGSRIVFTSASTTVQKSTAGSFADLSVGTSVTVEGSANSDGSLTAQAIQIRPAGMQSQVSR